jgi:hypothetical protein
MPFEISADTNGTTRISQIEPTGSSTHIADLAFSLYYNEWKKADMRGLAPSDSPLAGFSEPAAYKNAGTENDSVNYFGCYHPLVKNQPPGVVGVSRLQTHFQSDGGATNSFSMLIAAKAVKTVPISQAYFSILLPASVFGGTAWKLGGTGNGSKVKGPMEVLANVLGNIAIGNGLSGAVKSEGTFPVDKADEKKALLSGWQIPTSSVTLTTTNGFSFTCQSTQKQLMKVSVFDLRFWIPLYEIRIGGLTQGSWEPQQIQTWAMSVVASSPFVVERPLSIEGWNMDACAADFRRQGFVVIPGGVPKRAIQNALRAIHQSWAEKGIPQAQLPSFKALTWCPELCSTPPITDLYSKSVAPLILARWLQGPLPQVHWGQIALRFPAYGTSTVTPLLHLPSWHIDGIANADNGLEQGKLHSFSCLVGVLLKDVAVEHAGNLVVLEGGHTYMSQKIKKEGIDNLKAGKFPGIPKDGSLTPKPILGKAGDLVISHYLTPHAIDNNLTENIRYAVYFRVAAPSHEVGSRKVADLWHDFGGPAGWKN